ncbi:MAG TPA: hypothetical protein EYG25_00420 [Candidatus Poseidoniales archaeon]|uniref:Uncharacterized protein n=1 Tax=Marine Group III euryarchaeote TaxID=2173149 RepID=A0A7C8DHL0_9ARCH|nr:hypothetical protein [Marine Group III euryarchaeote]HIL32748.1 hypothetical protein [Candidatus Poseidoniales archaeon]
MPADIKISTLLGACGVCFNQVTIARPWSPRPRAPAAAQSAPPPTAGPRAAAMPPPAASSV